jgi:hypothetical protein
VDKSSPCRFVDSWWVCFVPLLPPSRRVAWRYGQSSFLVWCETHASISAPRSGERIQTCPQKRGRHSEGNRGTQSTGDRVADGGGWAGSLFRLLGQEDLPKEDRRDGVPFAILLFAVVGIIVAWFNVNQAWAQTLDAYTVGGSLGV